MDGRKRTGEIEQVYGQYRFFVFDVQAMVTALTK